MCYTGEKTVSRHYHGGESQERWVWFLGDEEFKPRNQTVHRFTPNWQVCWHVSSISFSEFSQLPTKTRPDFLETAEDGLSFQIFVRIFPIFALNISFSSSRSSLPPVDWVQVAAYFILKPWRLQFLVLQTPKKSANHATSWHSGWSCSWFITGLFFSRRTSQNLQAGELLRLETQ